MTSIEWTDATWNPVTGCSKVSAGCDNCYAETLSLRFGWSKLPWSPENAEANVVLHPERLDKPLKWREPRMVFVNSMSDLFHEEIPYEFIASVFDVMASADRHTFQVLTKRPRRALAFYRWLRSWESEGELGDALEASMSASPILPPNVWLGVSIESWRFNWRADVLREIPAAVRFISAEPLLDTLYPADHPERALNLDGIGWVIVGGESGNGFREMRPEWAREIEQARWEHCHCPDAYAGVHEPTCAMPAFFFKQWGGRTPKSGGRELDGREWSEYPSKEHTAAADGSSTSRAEAVAEATPDSGGSGSVSAVGGEGT